MYKTILTEKRHTTSMAKNRLVKGLDVLQQAAVEIAIL
jgi:hypothetical protein